MAYVYSTLANDNTYHYYVWSKNGSKNALEIPRISKSVLIKGGAGVANQHLVTPLGVVTQVSDEELEYLKTDEVFQTHVNNGFIRYEKKKAEIEVVVADMTARDNSAPVTPEDSIPEDAAQPSKENGGSPQRSAGKVKNNIK